MRTLLFLTPCLSFAGAEKILCWLAKEFSNRNCNSQILNLQLLDNNTNFNIDNLGNVTVHTLEPNKIPKTNNIHRIRGIVKIAREIKADAIISFTRYPCVLAAAAGTIAKIPVITSERGDPYQYVKGLRNKMEFLLLNSVAGCVFQTEYAMGCYSKKLQVKSRIIPNPVFINDFIPGRDENRNRKSIVSIGRYENGQKRYDVMLKGFSMFLKENPGYQLLLYGKGSDEMKIHNMISDLGIENSVHMMGLTKDSCKTMSMSEIFIITSDYEGIPNALLEAMSIGMPVISTDCSPGGAKYLINDHENGLLVSAGDVNGIARALAEFMSDEKLCNRCGEKAKEVNCLFNPQKIINEWEEYINLVCDN